jgi:hypothetical protein
MGLASGSLALKIFMKASSKTVIPCKTHNPFFGRLSKQLVDKPKEIAAWGLNMTAVDFSQPSG